MDPLPALDLDAIDRVEGDLFSLVADADLDLTVTSWKGREGISRTFSLEVLGTAPNDSLTLEESLLGRDLRLVVRHATNARSFHGVARSISAVGYDALIDRVLYRIEIAPRFALLSCNRTSRIFQNKTVAEIVTTVLAAHDVEHRFALSMRQPHREYCVQYQESDLAFVERILAEEGIFYFFEHPSHDEEMSVRERVVFADSAAAYAPIGGSPFVPLRDADSAPADEEYVTSFERRARVAVGAVLLKEFDYERPRLPRIGHATIEAANSRQGHTTPPPPSPRSIVPAISGAPIERTLRIYDHHGELEGGQVDPYGARIALEGARSNARSADGWSRCARLIPARVFELEGHPIEALDRSYVVVEVEHEGTIPERTAPNRASNEPPPPPYRNRFVCIPSDVVARPMKPAPRTQQVVETAIVVGPAGEEIHTDAQGRVKVHFHWDLEGRFDEHSSCWIRPMQPWAGAGLGFQFIPRVGTEVVVTFIGGDTDRPLILGGAYNGDHPTPFAVPHEKTRSGIRTRSTPGAEGYNELSFDDAAGAEEIRIHAQRDLDEVVERDHTALVKGNETSRVEANRCAHVRNDDETHVGRDQRVHVQRERTTRVEGNDLTMVRGDHDAAIDGDARRSVAGTARESLGRSEIEVRNHRHLGVNGSMTTLVGSHNDARSCVLHVEGFTDLSSSKLTEIRADEGIVLRCGKSMIRITEDRIELHSPSIVCRSEDADLSMSKKTIQLRSKGEIVIASDKAVDAQVDDAHVYIKSAKAPDSLADEAPKPTKIELVDDDGTPLAHQRFLVRDADGEKAGVLDGDGCAEMVLNGEATITFPDVAKIEEA